MLVHGHSSTYVIYREALELHTRRNLKLQLVNSTSSESWPRPFLIILQRLLLWSVSFGGKQLSGVLDKASGSV